jgi:hypothetical protein
MQRKPYVHIQIDGKLYTRHRLVWLFVHGKWAERIDHRNGIHGDDRISNLRLASRSQNSANSRMHKDNKVGLKGVRITQNKRYSAHINLGTFDTPEEAHAAYQRAAIQLHGEFARFS